MIHDDTIVAISSAVGPAARMIVRMSGPSAFALAAPVCPDLTPAAASVSTCRLRLSIRSVPITLPITVYTFVSPQSYTAEDLVEFHLPGNPLLAKILLETLLKLGARPAEPGEFTARAYFHGRLDLTEAEGVAATISAQNDQELRAARQLLAGELARRLRPVMESLAQTLALVEVGIDFSEEDVTFLQPSEIHQRVTDVDNQLVALVDESARFERLSHEPRVVLVGRPNAGKSTLLNVLAGLDRAIASPVAGTTRDALSVEVALERGLIRLVDVAGLDEPNAADVSTTHPSLDALAQVRQSMRDRALREISSADHVVLVQDASCDKPALSLDRSIDLRVFSKSDLVADRPREEDTIAVSAHTGANVGALRLRLDAMAFGAAGGGATLALNTRHLQSIDQARAALKRVEHATRDATTIAAELLAADLREGLDALGEILGSISPDDLLGRIFSAFCIGK